jgi:hypothetical protein
VPLYLNVVAAALAQVRALGAAPASVVAVLLIVVGIALIRRG